MNKNISYKQMKQPNCHPPTPNLFLNKKKPFLHPHQTPKKRDSASNNNFLAQSRQPAQRINKDNEEKDRGLHSKNLNSDKSKPSQFEKQFKNMSIHISTQQTEQRDSEFTLKSPHNNQSQIERIKAYIDSQIGSHGLKYFERYHYREEKEQDSHSSQSSKCSQKNRDSIDLYIKAIFQEYELGECVFHTPKFKEIKMSPNMKRNVKQFNADQQTLIERQETERNMRGNHKSKAKQLKNLFKKELDTKPEEERIISRRKTFARQEYLDKQTHLLKEKLKIKRQDGRKRPQTITIQQSFMKALYQRMKSLNLQSQKVIQLMEKTLSKQE